MKLLNDFVLRSNLVEEILNMFMFLIKGIAVGFFMGAVIGPIGILCIRYSLTNGIKMGLAVGLGAAVADALFGGIAAFGLTAISDFLIAHTMFLRFVGGGYLCYLGLKTMLTVPAASNVNQLNQVSAGKLVVSTLFLTLTNPVTIFAFLAIFTSFGVITHSLHQGAALLLVAGVFAGSGLWWILLSSLSSVFRSKLNTTVMRRVNQISGILIILFGVFTFIKG